MAERKNKKGLGRGFNSLIPTETGSEELIDSHGTAVRAVKIQDIVPNPDQPRKQFDEITMSELVDSIRTHGILQPIVVVREGAKFKLIAGERRWRATRELGHETIPAIVRTLDGQQRLEASLIENVQREDLNPIEIAETLAKLMEEFGLVVNDLAKRVGKAPTTVTNIIRLRGLPEFAKQALITGRISEGHARAVLTLSGDEIKQRQLVDYIIRNGWSVRQAEQFAAIAKRKPTAGALKNTAQTDEDTAKLTKKLAVSAPVKIHNMAQGRGRIIIEFKDLSEKKKVFKKLLD